MSNGAPTPIRPGEIPNDGEMVPSDLDAYIGANAGWYIDFGAIAAAEFVDSSAQIVQQSLHNAKLGTLRFLQDSVLSQIKSGNRFITMPPFIAELKNDPAQAEIYAPVIEYFDRLFNNGQAVERQDILNNNEFYAVGIGLATEVNQSSGGEYSWQITDQSQIDSYSTLRNDHVEQQDLFNQQAEGYGDALFDQLQLGDDLRDEFDAWFDGYIKQGESEMPQALFEAVSDDVGPKCLMRLVSLVLFKISILQTCQRLAMKVMLSTKCLPAAQIKPIPVKPTQLKLAQAKQIPAK